MTLPYTDPALPSAPIPYFMDNSFVRGDQMRANNQRIWGNSQSLDTRLTTAEGNITTLQTDLTLEFVKYGVPSINPLATLYQQWNTIIPYVSSKNLSSNPFYEIGDVHTRALTTLATVSAAPYADATYLPNGKILIVAYASGSAYNIYLYDRETGTLSASSGTPTITVSAHGAGTYYHSSCLLPNGKVLITVFASTTSYNLYLYDPSTDTAVAAGTPTINVTAVSGGISSCLLPNGKVLISVVASTTTYNLYLYDPVANTAVAAGTPTLTVTASSCTSMSMQPNGLCLITAYASTTTYNLYLYDPVANTAVAAGTPTLTVTATSTTMPSSCLVSNGKTLLIVYASTTTYNLYLYDYSLNSASAAGTSSITVTATAINAPSSVLLPSGNALVVVYSSTTTYSIYIYNTNSNVLTSIGLSVVTVSAAGSGGAAMSLNNDGEIFIIIPSSSTVYSYTMANGPFSKQNRYQIPIEMLTSGMI